MGGAAEAKSLKDNDKKPREITTNEFYSSVHEFQCHVNKV